MDLLPLPLDLAALPTPADIPELLAKLSQEYDNLPDESLTSEIRQSFEARSFKPGAFFRQAVVDSHLRRLPHVLEFDPDPYPLPPLPPVTTQSPEKQHHVFRSYQDLKTFFDANKILSDTAFVVHPIHQEGGGAERGLILTPLNSQYVIYMDAIEMGLDIFKCHWVFQDLASTAIVWSEPELQILKVTFGIRFHQILVLQQLVFPTTLQWRNLDLAAFLLIGQMKMDQWEVRVPQLEKEIDQDCFDAAERCHWLWYLSRRLLRFWPENMTRVALEKSRDLNNQGAGLPPSFTHYPWTEIILQHLSRRPMPSANRLKAWRGLQSLKMAISPSALFADETLSAVENLPENPSAAEWGDFRNLYLSKLSVSDADEVFHMLQNFDLLLAKANDLKKSTESQTLLSLSRSAGDKRCLPAIVDIWFLQSLSPSKLEKRMPRIRSTYRFGEKPADCYVEEMHHFRGMDMSYTLFHQDACECEILRILHRFCLPKNHRSLSNSPDLPGPQRNIKKRGEFTVCCLGHVFVSEVTLVHLPNKGLLVLVRRGDAEPH